MNMDTVSKMMDFESGQMTEEQIIEFFQELVDSGMAWTLQGFYGRMAESLIEQGLIEVRGN